MGSLARVIRRATLLLSLTGVALAAPGGAPNGERIDPEAALQAIIGDIHGNRLDAALQKTDALLDLLPNFRLAHLIRGDLLLARVRPLDAVGSVDGVSTATLADLREEALARLRAHSDRPRDGLLPRSLLRLSSDQKHAVVVDTSRSRLYVFRNERGLPRLVADYYVSQGKEGSEKWREGDKRTPVGVYFVTSSIPAAELPAFYGSGAFPINYPNEWDRRLGRDGYGIWLHGSPPDTYARPPRASDGCVVLANQDLDALSDFVTPGQTPVVIGEAIDWVPAKRWLDERKMLEQQLDAWRRDWESRDMTRYLGHYASDFRSDELDRAGWDAQRRRINGDKTWLRVRLSNLSMFRSPGREDLFVVDFNQHFESNNLNTTIRKRQYWIQRGGRWQIAYEGRA